MGLAGEQRGLAEREIANEQHSYQRGDDSRDEDHRAGLVGVGADVLHRVQAGRTIRQLHVGEDEVDMFAARQLQNAFPAIYTGDFNSTVAAFNDSQLADERAGWNSRGER